MSKSTKNIKLVVLGGGAAGLLIAMELSNTEYLSITLVDSKSFFEYTPGLCSVLYEATDRQFEKHFNEITFDYEPFLKSYQVDFVLGKVESIGDKKVQMSDKSSIDYDYLVICTGSSYADPWKVGSSDNESSTMDAHTRLESLRQHRTKFHAAQDILCIGGGPVGAELVTEVAYRMPDKRIVLVDSNDTVLSKAPNGIGKQAQIIINATPSIRSIMNEHASEKKEEPMSPKRIFETDKSHTRIETDLVYNCIGVTPNSDFLPKAWLDEKKQVIVDETLQVTGTHNVFAVGDVCSINEPKMFYTAHMQAVHFVKNLRRLLSNMTIQDLLPYQGAHVNMVISMGPHYAVGSISGVPFYGWPFNVKKGSRVAAVAKYFIERITMNDFGLKIPVNNLLYYTQTKNHGGLLPRQLAPS
ncbi:Apoptosis-inducing factor 2 [Choanephora cucurbitarum]|uniref:Apoptosis-inducing factor 2 n=1 Tax=Choanephora cucurbitarum TaxID=101091 RepID=A0A1C7NUX8_9FUNG|nr:Apoptosis-inducing factor 2 [Choanephora cucurbitarum]